MQDQQQAGGESLSQQFNDNGYVVIKAAIDTDRIDAYLQAYEEIKKSKSFIYYSQSTHLAIKPQLNEYGYIIESMQNASRLAFHKRFSSRLMDCLTSEGVSKALSAVSGEPDHVMWQNMFFDKSTGTVDHQDSWYLDTTPAGNLMGVWFALEDIQPDCGPFFVCPGSHKAGLISREEFPDHEDYVKQIQDSVAEGTFERKEMLLSKGDILIWHPFLTHGAFTCKNDALSRKSLTAHFYPRGMVAKDTEAEKLISVYNHESPKPTANPNLFAAYRYSDYVFNSMTVGKFLWDKLRSNTAWLPMSRDHYQKN